jgi:NAD(P)-dependent dehydrogenase (short-subunit alcohol dehydrogenase family)
MPASNAVLITGCSSGTGRAAALAFARLGVPTWATARRVEALDDLRNAGCTIMQLDVTDEQSRARAVKAVEAEHGAVGILVNNAGYAQSGPVEEVTLDMLQRQFDTNLFGLIRMCQLAIPAMRAHGGGTVINIGSAAGLIGPTGATAYSMTKWALEALSDGLRWEVTRFGINVTLIEPGGVLTNFNEVEASTWPPEDDSSPYRNLRDNIHQRMRRFFREGSRAMSKPEDVARVIVKAATARQPKTRYKVGVAPRLMPALYRVLPNRTWDAMMSRQFPAT